MRIFDGGLIVLYNRATEENNKLKARYEQAKEETENLVSITKRLNHVMHTLKVKLINFSLTVAERENRGEPGQVC